MKFTLSPIAAKVFGRSVQALAKVGEELVLSSTLNDGLILQSANTAKSAFGCVTFGNEFFQKRDAIYKFSGN
ncbi:cell cycle checkpoint control protein RAD9A-like [Tropilaelaps mercedesae]|uniref:Cell cycle checkpoint control protein RAD9A-like n=1 Tax=Tropilaelaps mercedesae TaxID=418985 RepID=A0A1V9XMI2_9ACAR|nr:cell cycle checkpoint control protein RAD9A-like [Tropilaelaps mercedesae]